ncbi:MAG: isocitrate/isopropylmalate family dehydrogenase [Gemmatimonadota bacterium]
MIPGDGIGPEVIAAAIPIIAAATKRTGHHLEFEFLPWSAEHYLRTGETLPEPGFIHLRDDVDGILLGALGDPRVPGHEHARDILLGLRQRLDLYVNLRPLRRWSERLTPLRGGRGAGGQKESAIDFVIFRENTEGQYVGRDRVEHAGQPDEAHISEEVNSIRGVSRIIEAAFEWAQLHHRTRLTLCDKSNAIAAQRIWPRIFAEIGSRYPAIEREHRYVDTLAMELVQDPSRFQVIVTTNLYGDILSELATGLVGGPGVAASANLHPGRPGLFEPVHGSAPALAGTGKANPIATILAGALMLEQLGLTEPAGLIEAAVRQTLGSASFTPDLGGTATTAMVAASILKLL